MAGETDLETLLRSLEPTLEEDTYVFCTVKEGAYGDLVELQPISSFAEKEGLTLVVTEERARSKALSFEGSFRLITLQVHSSLEAVGLTAAVSGALTAKGISANIIAAYFHDHVFVPAKDADAALHALQSLRSTGNARYKRPV